MLFRSAAIREGRASVVTDHIERFEADGVRLKSGELLPADVIVTATGLDLQLMGGVPFTVDGQRVEPAQSLGYKAMMYSAIPNLAPSFGYPTARKIRQILTASYWVVCHLVWRQPTHTNHFLG